MLKNSLFLDDKAILNLYGILASGEEHFFIAIAHTDIAFRCNIKQLENGNFQVEFDIPQSAHDRINIEDFYAKPAVLAIPKPSNRKDLPDFNIIINPTDVECINSNHYADENKPTHVTVTIRGFQTLFDDSDRKVAKHTVLYKYNPKTFSPANKGFYTILLQIRIKIVLLRMPYQLIFKIVYTYFTLKKFPKTAAILLLKVRLMSRTVIFLN